MTHSFPTRRSSDLCGVAYHNLPGYIPIPKADHESLDGFVKAVTPKPLSATATNFWSGTDRFTVSQLKAYYGRSEEHTSELQSLMRISYAVFCLKKKTHNYEHK